MAVKWTLTLKGEPDYKATITLNVKTKNSTGKPTVASKHPEFKGALEGKLKTPFSMVGHILDGDNLLPHQVQHNLQIFNSPPIYDLQILEGADLVEYPKGELPEGAIP